MQHTQGFFFLNPSLGAIELSILSKHYQTEIAVVDIETGRVDRYGKNHFYICMIRVVLPCGERGFRRVSEVNKDALPPSWKLFELLSFFFGDSMNEIFYFNPLTPRSD